jgi:hypothetical protein
MLTTQGLASGTLGELRAALAAFADSGVPATATVSTKRARGGNLTEVSAEWTQSVEVEADESNDRSPSAAPPIPPSS